MPKFSVVIPVYNKLPHLERSINSVLEQTYTDFELLLIDDASTDGSSDKLKDFSSNSKIRLFSRNEPGPGGYAARNLGIKKAKGEWIAFLDADDEWDKNYLNEVFTAIELYINAQVFTVKWKKTLVPAQHNPPTKSHNLKKHIEFNLKDYLNQLEFMWTSAVVVNKELIKDSGGFPTDKLCKRGGDIDTWIRLLALSNENIFINSTLAYYHQGTVNQVTAKPNTYFCAYDSLMKIYRLTNERNLQKAIIKFNNKFIYNMLMRQINAGKPVDYSQLKKMFWNNYSILRVLKLHVARAKKIIYN